MLSSLHSRSCVEDGVVPRLFRYISLDDSSTDHEFNLKVLLT